MCPNLYLIKCVIIVFSITKLGAGIFQSVLQLGCGLSSGGIWVLSPVEALIFLFVIVSGCGAHPHSYPLGCGTLSLGVVWLRCEVNAKLHVMLRLGICRDVLPLPNTSSWCGVLLNMGIFTVTFTSKCRIYHMRVDHLFCMEL